MARTVTYARIIQTSSRFHEIDEIDSVTFIATEFIDGETLGQRLRHAPMNLGEVLDVVIQCASALSAAHARGIVHIKPEKVIIRLTAS